MPLDVVEVCEPNLQAVGVEKTADGTVVGLAIPLQAVVIPVYLIIIKLQEYDYAGAAAIGVIMLAVSFVFLLALNGLQAWVSSRR